jgi:hypothetical protein
MLRQPLAFGLCHSERSEESLQESLADYQQVAGFVGLQSEDVGVIS